LVSKKHKEGSYVVRFKGDMKSLNYSLRDTNLFRIIDSPHPLTGTKYTLWPTYDIANAVEDEICGITHILRSSEFRNELQQPPHGSLGRGRWAAGKGDLKMLQRIILLILVGCFAFGCTSVPLKMSSLQNKVPDKDYQVLGEGEGEAVGIMLFGLIPIGQNDRFERAYDLAIQSKGGNRIIDPVISETWFWGFILNGYATKISGTVVKDIK
jgi:hypothetical protein